MKRILIMLVTYVLAMPVCQCDTDGGKMVSEWTKEAVIMELPEDIYTETNGNGLRTWEWNDEESYMLAKIAMSEAESENTEGKALVILVVLNRVLDDDFPDSVEEVITQENQFAPVANGRYDRVEPDADCQDALALVAGGWDESKGALYFESRSSSAWHQKNLKYLFKHGNHYFYKEKEDSREKKDSN